MLIRQLFEETVGPLPGLSTLEHSLLVDIQFRGREQTYTAQFPGAENYILCLKDGTAAGRCLLVRQPGCLRVVDLSVLRARRREGIATAALRHVQKSAAEESRHVRLRVMKDNPALQLYHHLGFLSVSQDELSFEMDWQPPRTSRRSQAKGRPSNTLLGSAIPALAHLRETRRHAYTTLAAALLAWQPALYAQGILTVTPGRVAQTSAGTGMVGYTGDGGAATNAALARPSGIAYDGAGNLFVADTNNHVVRQITPSGVITTVAGTGAAGFGGDGGAATAAFLDTPTAVAVDAAGHLYIADSHNHRIRAVSSGVISTVAGTGVPGFAGDGGPSTTAQLALPTGVAVDANGNVYVADTNNQRVRKLSGGTLSTVAGNGEEWYAGDGGQATAASLDQPTGVAVDATGNLYIADKNNQRVRVVNTAGAISTLAGNGTAIFSGTYGGDGGSATGASLAHPVSVAVDASGNLLVADTNNQRIRRIGANGIITTVAGSGDQGFGGDGGLATAAILNSPLAVASGASGNLAIADTRNQRLRASLPGELDFPSQAVGTTSAPQSVTLSNTGSAALSIGVLAFAGPFQAVAGGSCPSPPFSLSAGASCVQSIAFQPSAAGTLQGSVTASGQSIASQTVALKGTAATGSTSLALSANRAAILSGETVQLTATLSTPNGSARAATGSVTFYAGTQPLGSSPVTLGAATFSTASLPDGQQPLTAVYVGNASFASSTSGPVSENVADLALTLASVIGTTVVPGHSTAVPVMLQATGAAGLNGSVTLGTATLPAGLGITFSPATTAFVNGQLAFTMNVTAAPAMAGTGLGPTGSGIIFALLLLPLRRLRRPTSQSNRMPPALLLLLSCGGLAALGSLTGCGSGSGYFGQSQQTYNVTIIATATDSSGGVLTRSTVVPLTVQ